MNRREKLTDAQRKFMAGLVEHGRLSVSEWDLDRVRSIAQRGLIHHVGGYVFEITDAGRSLLQNPGDER